jgi:hypothetical protein
LPAAAGTTSASSNGRPATSSHFESRFITLTSESHLHWTAPARIVPVADLLSPEIRRRSLYISLLMLASSEPST